eukprot:Phypoly_transcript_26515.p1 GENE.Phypoly_transcript_26515~~Phypoly_transcript_26515.p1  ORF type:complete len:145 (+),score=12.88 Phypoly_transcript_26515:32-436(+)
MKWVPSETNLFFINALVEGGFGIIQFFNPGFLYVGAERYASSITAGRMAGALMFTLGLISYEGAKTNSGRNAIGKGMLFYHVCLVALFFYTFSIGGYLPGPDVAGVPEIAKLASACLIHVVLGFWFSKYVRLTK